MASRCFVFSPMSDEPGRRDEHARLPRLFRTSARDPFLTLPDDRPESSGPAAEPDDPAERNERA